MSVSFTGTYPNTIVLDTPSAQNPATVASSGFVQVTDADGVLGTAGYPWNVTNLGTVAIVGSSGDGIHLTAGGVVTNGLAGSAAGSISGPTAGVEIDGAAGTINNFGAMASPTARGAGILLDAGGSITNGASGETAPLIVGGYNGIFAPSAAATIVNYGRIEAPGAIFNGGGAANVAVFLAGGGSVQNGSAGSTGALIDGYHIGLSIPSLGASATVTNFGRIEGTGTYCNNGAGADGPEAGVGVLLAAPNPVLRNGASGSTSAVIEGYYRGLGTGYEGSATVVNFGTIASTQTGLPGIRYFGNAIVLHNGGTITNYGLIQSVQNGVWASTGKTLGAPGTITNLGTIAETGSFAVINGHSNLPIAVALFAGGTITNGQNGFDTGLIEAGWDGIVLFNSPGTVRNFGTIESTASIASPNGFSAAGVILDAGGIVINGATGATGALIQAYETGIYVGGFEGTRTSTGGTIVNYGTIRSSGAIGEGVQFASGGTLTNRGLITAAGTGVSLGDTAGTVDNFGTIIGASGTAIRLGTGNDKIILEAGSRLQGVVSNFQSGDSFDLPSMAFSSSGTATLQSGNVLKIVENGGTFTINLDPNQDFTNEFFHLTSDGAGGSLITVGRPYDLFAAGQPINIAVTSDPNSLPAPVSANFNLELITNASGTGNFTTASGYQGLAILSTDGRTLTLLHGDYGVVDDGNNDSITAGDGNVSIGGAAGDTLIGGTGSGQFLDGDLGNQSVLGGSGGNETIWGGSGDTIQGGAGNETIGGVAGDTIIGGAGTTFIDGDLGNQSVLGGSGGNTTIWGGSGDTIRGGAGNETIGGVAGDTIIGGAGTTFIDGDLGNQSVLGGSAGNTTIWGGSGDTIRGGSGNETIGGVAGDTIIGGSGTTFIDADLGHQSILGGAGNTTIWGASGDTIQGASGSGSATIAFGMTHTAETLWDNGSTSSGNDSVYNFSQSGGDRISINTATDAITNVVLSAVTSGGNTTVTLSDGSNIALIGVAGVSNAFFTTH